ncbi:MAG: Uma2 family endonuclease [Myxococcales bacterium]|jgi:Uma2 family endonuclease
MVAPYRKQGATLADLDSLPENAVGELVGGELIVRPRPAFPHAVTTSTLGFAIGAPFQAGRGGPGGWRMVFEPELHLGPDVLVPDLAGWRRERMPTRPGSAGVSLAPDWVCEVVSRSTASIDRGKKRAIYLREKVRHLWLVDPLARTLEVFERGDGNWILLSTHADDARVRAPPFEAIELDLLELWGEESNE